MLEFVRKVKASAVRCLLVISNSEETVTTIERLTHKGIHVRTVVVVGGACHLSRVANMPTCLLPRWSRPWCVTTASVSISVLLQVIVALPEPLPTAPTDLTNAATEVIRVRARLARRLLFRAPWRHCLLRMDVGTHVCVWLWRSGLTSASTPTQRRQTTSCARRDWPIRRRLHPRRAVRRHVPCSNLQHRCVVRPKSLALGVAV